MKISEELLRQIKSDLGLNAPFIKGQRIIVRNCWHFYTDGSAVDVMFYDIEDFKYGMNSVYIVLQKYGIIILAFVLMDNHIHFVLYGDFDACKRFMHDYVKRLSQRIGIRHGDRNKLDNINIGYQQVDTDEYLKTVICYVVKNPSAGGVPFMGWYYPWSSGPLYFVPDKSWTIPAWADGTQSNCFQDVGSLTVKGRAKVLGTNLPVEDSIKMIDGMIFPGEYVAVDIVHRIFKTCKSYNYFMCRTREDDVDSRGGIISNLSIPIQELRQHRTEICKEMFGKNAMNTLTTQQRIALARAMRRKFNSSPKQIAKACGLIYDEVKNLI